MSFNPGYAGHQGNAPHPCYVHQQCDVHQHSPVNQLRNIDPEGGFGLWRVNSSRNVPFMDDEENQPYDQGDHGTISEQDTTQQFGAPNKGFAPNEAFAIERGIVNQQAGVHYQCVAPQTPMSLNSFNSEGYFNQQAGVHNQGVSPQPTMGFEQFNNGGDICQPDGMHYQGFCPQALTPVGPLNNYQSNFHPQCNTHYHQANSPQEVMNPDPFNGQPANFHQQNDIYQKWVNTNFQADLNTIQTPAYNPSAAGVDFTQTGATSRTIARTQEEKEALRKALDEPFDMDAMIGNNNKLLKAAADYHAAGLANSSANGQTNRSADDSRNLQYDWIMGSLKVNLTYLQARRRREQAEMKGEDR
ncbi:hypothetical protein PITC_000440 [Penicillium italicum]|uniref:Uncharacterized protein n=1 Tax=Penicillium italicum TaxID=40296 RepID=A0A0A2KRM1_PENIT|nr:hypothetical protein PITC_000440 [Penicillium italicum]